MVRVSSGWRSVTSFVLGGGALIALHAAAGCSPAHPEAAGDGLSSTGPGPRTCGASSTDEGCACVTPDVTAECGTVHEIVGDETFCSMGHTRCLATGRWSACTSDVITTRTIPRLHIAGLGTPGPCANPCDPYCSTTTDTPPGLTFDGGLTVDDAGLTLLGQPQPPGTCTGIAISPSASPATDIVVTSSSTLATKNFTTDLLPLGCNPAAPPPLWYDNQFDVAQIDATGKLTVVVPIAGPVTVGASLGTFTNTVPATVTVQIQENGLNTPPAGATFASFPAETGATPADTNLELLYPYNGTVLPLGLLAPLVQWRNNGAAATGGVIVTLTYPSTGTPIFSVSQLVSETMAAPVPLRTAQPRYVVPQSLWLAFEQTVHRNRATSGDTGRISVRRKVGATAYASKYVDVRFAPGQLKGRVYYQSYGTALVTNFSGAQQTTGGAFPGGAFGAATLVIPAGASAPSVAAGSNSNCVVCHSASADGSTLVTSLYSSDMAYKWTLPGTPPSGGTSLGQTILSFAGINPTATRMISSASTYSGDSSSRLFNLSGGLLASNLPAALQGGFPTFSTDGAQVALVHRAGTVPAALSASGSSIAADGTSVAMMSFDGNATFSGFRKLATPAGGAPAAYPAFLPAGQNGVVYQVETRTSPDGGYGVTRHDCECSTYSGATGELWWVTTGAAPVATRMHRANGYDATGTANALPATPTTGHAVYGGTTGPAGAGFYEQRYNYEPTVLPKVIGGYSWVIFTSRRQYGNVATINPYASDPRYDNISIDPTPKKLWVAAVSASPGAGTDPSFPAFYLPGQELIAGNSRAVFSLDACQAPSNTLSAANLCDSDLDCCGAPTTAACVLDPPPFASAPTKHCLPVSAGVCRTVGQTCLLTSNCCNAVAGGVCSNGVCKDPPPYFSPQTFTRDYAAKCLPGYAASWSYFEWQSKTPGDSKIQLFAQTGDGTTWSPAAPVAIGTASGADVVPPTWAQSGVKVSKALGSATGTSLRITMAFSPSTDNTKAPTLIDWRQSIVCTPVE